VDYKGVSTKSNAVDGKERATGDPSVGGVSAKAAPKLHSGGLAQGLLGGLGYLGMKVFLDGSFNVSPPTTVMLGGIVTGDVVVGTFSA
jgi:hypothetical protein